MAILVADDELFEDEIGDLGLDGESEDKFESVGDFVDASGSQALVANGFLSPASASILALAQNNPVSQEIWSLGNCVAETQFPRKNHCSNIAM